MCGIGGWVLRPGGNLTPSATRMAAALRHRGPDEGGEIGFDGVGLVFRRLSLLDLLGGNQPVCDEREQVWSVFNGEIYNHADLRAALRARGHVLQGTGDAELIPHLYEEHGVEFVTRLRGMFAIALHDRSRGRTFLLRDRFGIKPLYLHESSGGYVFGSEIRAVLSALPTSPQIDPLAVRDYLTYGYVPDPETMWQGLRQVLPGHYVELAADGRCWQTCYWRPDLAPGQPVSLQQSAASVERAVEGSVRAHLEADVPVGAYLSSGVDSSYLVALARRVGPVQTFSVGFDLAEGSLDELAAARELARELGTDHHEEVVTGQEYLHALPGIVAAQEMPLADPSAPALWFLARSAAREVKAVLSGEGADELFAGYPIFRQPAALRAFELLPAGVARGLHAAAFRLPSHLRGRSLLLRGTTPLPRRFLGSAPLFDRASVDALTGGASSARGDVPERFVEDEFARTTRLPQLVRMQTASLRTWLPGSILAKADMMAMAHSLEVRVPFLDPAVFDAAARLPLRQRVNRTQTKIALRAAAARALPGEVADRPKLGFPVPFRAWLDGVAGQRLRELAVSGVDDVLDRAAVLSVAEDQQHRDRYRRQWALLVYLLWREQLSPAGAPPGNAP